jgi:hypothetical protein
VVRPSRWASAHLLFYILTPPRLFSEKWDEDHHPARQELKNAGNTIIFMRDIANIFQSLTRRKKEN